METRLIAAGSAAIAPVLLTILYALIRVFRIRRRVKKLSDQEVEHAIAVLGQESGNDLHLGALFGETGESVNGVSFNATNSIRSMLLFGVTMFTTVLVSGYRVHHQHLPRPTTLLRGSPIRRLGKALDIATSGAIRDHIATPPATRRRFSGGPSRWNWLHGRGILLTSILPLDHHCENVIRQVPGVLDAQYNSNALPPGTVLAIRMDPTTRAWGILIVDANFANANVSRVESRHPVVSILDALIGFDDQTANQGLSEHGFKVRNIGTKDIRPWVEAHEKVVLQAVEYANESRMMIV
jgi:hypothetical protein